MSLAKTSLAPLKNITTAFNPWKGGDPIARLIGFILGTAFALVFYIIDKVPGSAALQAIAAAVFVLAASNAGAAIRSEE